MGDTIKIDINKLNSALSKLDALATSIDTQRRSAISNCPISLPSLEDGTLGATSKFLTDQRPELQTRLDLAKLLDQDGDGQASYTVDHGDQLWEVKRALSDEMTNQLKNLDVDSKESRERAALLAGMLNRYKDDPDISWQVMNALGPKGVTTVMNKLKNLVGEMRSSTYADYTDNRGAENQALIALQESMGNGLSLMFSSASSHMDGKWGKEIAQDPWAAAVMMRYIDKANKDIDPKVFEAMGVELKNREHNDPMIWSQMFGPYANHFGEQTWKTVNPMQEYLNLADNSTRDAQAVMGNKDLRHYFTSERQDYDHLSNQAGKVLGVATIDAANSENDQYAKNAAQISSDLLHDLGGKSKPLAGIKEEVGGIVATYIADANRVHSGNNDLGDPGSHLWDKDYPYAYGIGEDSGLPKYGIKLNQADLRGALEDVGDNDAAVSAVGKATTIFNLARLEYAAAHQKDDPSSMHKAAHESATFGGFMTDAVVNGDIDNEEAAAKQRKKVAQMFTAPIDLVKTDKLPVIGGLIKSEVKDAIIEGYTADKTPDAIKAANDASTKGMTLTQLQALYAMEKHDVPTGITDWPQDHGQPKSPEHLSPEELRRVLLQAERQTGVTSDTTGEIENAWDDSQKKYGDN